MRRRILLPFLLLFTTTALAWGFLSLYLIYQGDRAVPPEQARAQLTDLQRIGLFAFLLTLLTVTPLIVWIAERARQPLRQIIQQAKFAIQEDQAEGSTNGKTTDEIALLRHSFYILLDQLNSSRYLLNAERERFHTLLEAANDAIVLVNEEGLVQAVNTSAERTFGFRREDVLNRSLAESLRHHQIVELWRNCQQMRRPQNSLIEVATPRLYLQAFAHLISDQPPSETLLVFQNLTRQRYLETVRRDFISNISHELRTPLASLKALTETLQEGALDDLVTARHFLQHIEAEVDTLTQLVNELLELSRIESGKVPLQKKPISPREALLPAVNRLRLQAERAGLKMTVDCPEDLPHIAADVIRLEQVIVNLLHNAIKFTPVDGTIQISARVAEEGESDQLAVLFSIRDTGVGIPAEDLPRIFERFYKADRARTSSGTGLGLAIARHIVEAHEGKIWAESIQGQGSTFYFSIPCSEPQATLSS